MAAKDLTVVSVAAKLVSVKDAFTFSECGVPIVAAEFTYAVDMLLANEGTATSKGIVLVKFYNDNAGVVLDELGQPVSFPVPTRTAFVEIPAEASKDFHEVFSFEDLPLEPGAEPHRVTVETTLDQPDPTCGGTGKLSFIDFLKVITSK